VPPNWAATSAALTGKPLARVVEDGAVVGGGTNAVKHAHATKIEVRGWQQDQRLLVEVTDDGCGGADPLRGSGLSGLGYRVRALGGTLTVHSPPGHGTSIMVELPCA
jgi:signal transduction histidine kinase